MGLLLMWHTYAQGQNGYIFREFSEAYIPVPDGDTLTPSNWDDPELELSNLFPVKLFGKAVTGPILWDSALGFEDSGDSLSVISPWTADLISSQVDTNQHLSPVIYYPDPVFDQRLFTIEWRNAHFYLLDGFFDFVNFQFHYFNDGTIQFRYGPSVTSLAKVAYQEEGEVFGGFTGIGSGPEDTLIVGLFLEGAPESFTILENELGLLEDFPEENTVYGFKPIQSNVSNHDATNRCFTYIHHRDQNFISIREGRDRPFALVSTSGHEILVSSRVNGISLSGLPAGIYVLVQLECGQSELIYHK